MNNQNAVIKSSLTLESLVYFNTENQKLKHKITSLRLFFFFLLQDLSMNAHNLSYVGASQQVRREESSRSQLSCWCDVFCNTLSPPSNPFYQYSVIVLHTFLPAYCKSSLKVMWDKNSRGSFIIFSFPLHSSLFGRINTVPTTNTSPSCFTSLGPFSDKILLLLCVNMWFIGHPSSKRCSLSGSWGREPIQAVCGGEAEHTLDVAISSQC